MILQLVTATGTAINTTLAALAAVTGDTLAVANFDGNAKKAWILQVWANVQLAGTLRIKSPKFHDNVNGIRIDTVAADVSPLLPWGTPERISPNDVLSVELAGSSTGGDVEHVTMLQAYEDIQGQVGKLLTPDQVASRFLHLVTVENTITTGTGGIWSGAEGINAEIDQFQTDYDYAILGYKTDTICQAVGYRSPAWANTRVGGPGFKAEPYVVSNWFKRISEEYGIPAIPVFAGSDKASCLVDVLIDENGADPTITTYLAALKRG